MTPMAEPHDEAPNADGEELHRFSEYALPEPLMQAINELGYERCTPIQSQVLPLSLADYDITGQAQTGTGKTAAFLITILTHLWEQPRKHTPSGRLPAPRSLVLAPTRELAMQIEADGQELARHMDQDALCVVGGMDIQKQVNRLNAERPNILIATPGRLIDLLQRGWVDIGSVEILVIDEADRMLDMGFIPDVRRIVYRTPHKHRRQTLFFSATFNDDVMRLAQSWTLEPEHIAIAPEQVAVDTVEQLFWLTSREGKRRLLRDFIQVEQPDRALIFTNRRDQTHRLNQWLNSKGIDSEALAGDVPQNKRTRTLSRFKEGRIRYVVATDVAGRGIHVDGISHVINYDLPEDAEDYVHRIGRTGRAGASGVSISFVSEDDAFNLPAIEEFLGAPVKCVQPRLDTHQKP